MSTKENIKMIAMLSTITIIIFLLTIDVRNKNQELQLVKASLIEAQKPSKIEQLKEAKVEVNKLSEKAKSVMEQSKENYEKSIWLSRCIETNIDLELKNEKLEDCENNLERFAEYNIVK